MPFAAEVDVTAAFGEDHQGDGSEGDETKQDLPHDQSSA